MENKIYKLNISELSTRQLIEFKRYLMPKITRFQDINFETHVFFKGLTDDEIIYIESYNLFLDILN